MQLAMKILSLFPIYTLTNYFDRSNLYYNYSLFLFLEEWEYACPPVRKTLKNQRKLSLKKNKKSQKN